MSNHRYVLHRQWIGNGRLCNFIMLNPSTADDVFDDPTIRRCIGFSKRWGFSRLVVTNLCAYRATRPSDLLELVCADRSLAIGDGNDGHILDWANVADLVVCAWGDNCELVFDRDVDVIATLRHRDLYCIRRTMKGNPAHPVREKYTDTPQMFYRAETPVRHETEKIT